MSTLEVGPSGFFRDHLESFINLVDLDIIVPKLSASGRCLLTQAEYETVTHAATIPWEKKRKLADILYSKPPEVPWIVLECLRDERYSGPLRNHLSLAEELGCYLRKWPGGSHQFTLPSSERSFEHRVDPLNGLCTTSQQYLNLLRGVSSELNRRNFDREKIVQILDSMQEDCNLVLRLPTAVVDFGSLMVFLHERGISHEYDTDFLCMVLSLVPSPELQCGVREYSNSLLGTDVLQHILPGNARPSSDHFLAFTFHALPGMTLRQVLGMKDILAAQLGVPRYSFSLRGAKEGSVVLVWQFRAKSLEHFYMNCDKEKLGGTLDREDKVGAKSMEKIEVQFQTSDNEVERKVVFDRVQGRKRRRSDEISSTTEEENSVVPAKVRRNGGDNACRGMSIFLLDV